MKHCENCGYVKLSNKERKLIDLLPIGTVEAAEKLGVTYKNINKLLCDLKVHSFVYIKETLQSRANIWDKNEDRLKDYSDYYKK